MADEYLAVIVEPKPVQKPQLPVWAAGMTVGRSKWSTSGNDGVCLRRAAWTNPSTTQHR